MRRLALHQVGAGGLVGSILQNLGAWNLIKQADAMSRDAMRGLTSTFLSMGPYAVSAKAVDRTLQRVGRAVGEAAFYWLAPDLDAAVGLAALHRGDLA